jgi:hypothetical protein
VLRTLPFVLLVVILAAIAPGVARADDSGVAASVTKWTLRIGPKANALSTEMSASTSPDKALVFLDSFTRVARQGAAGIAATKPSSPTGARLKLLARRSFVNFSKSGTLLIQAVKMKKAGKSDAEIGPVVDQAVKLANNGSVQLKNAGALIAKIAG